MSVRVALVLVMGAALGVPAPASASGWSPTRTLDDVTAAGCPTKGPISIGCFPDTQLSAAINGRGRTVVAWGDSRGHLRVSNLGHQASADLGRAYGWDVGISLSGTVTAVWQVSGRLRLARRLPGGRFGRPVALAPKGSKEGDGEPHVIPQPDGRTVVVYTSPFRSPTGSYVERLRSVDVDAHGRPAHYVELGRRGLRLFSSASTGDIGLCCRMDGSPDETIAGGPAPGQSLLVRPSGATGFTAVPLRLAERESLEALAVRAGGTFALGTVDVRNGGDAGTLGTPMVRLGALPDRVDAPTRAPVQVAGRAFGPVVDVDDRGRVVLLWQEKTRSEAFSRAAPLHALVGDGPTQTLDGTNVLGPLLADGLLVWNHGGRWRAARQVGARFAPLRPPGGSPGSYLPSELAAAGGWRVLAWSQPDGRVRASTLRLPD